MNKYINSTMISGVAATVLLTAIVPASFARDYYVGVAGGASFLTVKNDGTYTYDDNVFGAPDQSDKSATGSASGAVGEIYLGLATQPMDRFYLATELNITGLTGSANTEYSDEYTTQATTSYDSKVNYAAGISVLPGYVVSDKTLLYTRVGINYTQFQSIAAETNTSVFESSIKESVVAYRLGLGVDQFIRSSNFSLRIEGDYWGFNKVNKSGVSALGAELNQDFQPSIITGLVGLTYHFGAQSDTTSK